MEKIKQAVFLVLLACQISFCIVPIINPANYIWINYNAQVPLSLTSDSKYSVSLPCQTRIGKCSYQFTVLPPGWEVTKSGTLNIPNRDATGNGNFAIEGQFSEPTGQRLNANLVVNIQNGILTVMDKSEYYKKIGYTAPDYGNSIKSTNYEESLLTKNLPDGFVPLPQLEAKIVNNNISSITSIIDEVISNYAPCRPRLNYLKEVKAMILKLISTNNDKINSNNGSIKQLQNIIKNLKLKKQNMLKTQGISKQIENYQKQIDFLAVEINGLKLNEVKYDTQVQNILNKISKYQIQVESVSSPQLVTALGQLGKVSLELEDLYNKNLDLEQQIRMARLQSQIKGVPKQSIPNLQRAYTTVTKLVTKSKVSFINRDLKIKDLNNQKILQQQLILIIDQYLNKLQNVSPKKERVNALSISNNNKKIKNQNQQLNQSINLMKVMVGYTKCGGLI